MLAVVAIATAWSGYQAALWTGNQSELYGQAGKLRVQAEAATITANQERLYNAATVAEWLKAEAQGQKDLAEIFERRLLADFRPEFEAWKRTDPIRNPGAPPNPESMTDFHSPKTEEATQLNRQATETFIAAVPTALSDLYFASSVELNCLRVFMTIASCLSSFLITESPTWGADWAWGLPLIVLTVHPCVVPGSHTKNGHSVLPLMAFCVVTRMPCLAQLSAALPCQRNVGYFVALPLLGQPTHEYCQPACTLW